MSPQPTGKAETGGEPEPKPARTFVAADDLPPGYLKTLAGSALGAPRAPDGAGTDSHLDQRRRRRRAAIRVVAGVAAAACLVGLYVLARPLTRLGTTQVLEDYRTDMVRRGEVSDQLTGSGTVTPGTTVTVRSALAGLVSGVAVEEGTPVTPGVVLVRIDSESAREELDAARAEVTSRSSELEQAETTLRQVTLRSRAEVEYLRGEAARRKATADKIKSLCEGGAATRVEWQQAQADAERASLDVETAVQKASSDEADARSGVMACRAELTRATQRLAEALDARARAEVSCPTEGVVTKVVAERGQAVSPGSPLVEVADLRSLQVKVDLPADTAHKVAAGQPATVQAAGATYRGVVTRVAPSASTCVVSLTEGQLGRLRPGSGAQATITTSTIPDALYLPRGAYLLDADGFVFVVQGSVARRRPARLQLVGANYVVVTEGLSAGDEVITSSYEKIARAEQVRLRRQETE